MKLRVHPEVDDEVKDAVQSLNAQQPSAGDRFFVEYQKHLQRIQDDPWSLPKLETAPRRLDIRRTLIRRFHYLVIFEMLSDDEVLLLGVAHGNRRSNYWLKRRSTKL